ncbi:MAG TPA: hypothetical protein VMS56_10510 [Thermoanaerobaculia bacterium]|nr:hypothetical protein [Thermoanaerobaculia bacterium]
MILLLSAACATALPTRPNDREWTSLWAEYQTVESLRRVLPQPPPGASRSEHVEIHLRNQQRLEPTLAPLLGRLREYHGRTGDPRAARLLANERIRLGDAYMSLLARYERAIELYRSALAVDPDNDDARRRLNMAQSRRFVSMDDFASVRAGMSEREVASRLGTPREDWIKHARQDDRLYSVWIFPREDGGAAAVYFDDGIVYHVNWNAAAPQPTP